MTEKCSTDEIRIVVKSRRVKRVPYAITEVNIPTSVTMSGITYTRSRRVLFRELSGSERLRLDDEQARAVERARKFAAETEKRIVIEDVGRRSTAKKVADMLMRRKLPCSPALVIPCENGAAPENHRKSYGIESDSIGKCFQ